MYKLLDIDCKYIFANATYYTPFGVIKHILRNYYIYIYRERLTKMSACSISLHLYTYICVCVCLIGPRQISVNCMNRPGRLPLHQEIGAMEILRVAGHVINIIDRRKWRNTDEAEWRFWMFHASLSKDRYM